MLHFLIELGDNTSDLFERIKRLPKKARTAKKYNPPIHPLPKGGEVGFNGVTTFFRKGKLRKIFNANKQGVEEVDFFRAVEILKAEKDTPKENLPKDFYDYLDANKKEFELATADEVRQLKHPGSRSYESKLLQTIKAIKAYKGFTEDDEEYLNKLLKIVEEGALPKQTAKKLINAIARERDPLKILSVLRGGIPHEFFKEHISESAAETHGPREVILSEYLLRHLNSYT